MTPLAGHAIITGGSSGIGLATARLLAQSGMDVSLIARGEARLAAAKAALDALRRRPAQKFAIYPADIGDPDQAERAVGLAIATSGAPDLLVTSAGIARPGYFAELPREAFEEAMRVNYFGTLHAIRAAVPPMRERRRGRIALVSSGAGLFGIFGYSAYAPSKFALRGLAETLRAELRGDGIGVSIIYPPDTDTPQLAEENRMKPRETRRITRHGGLWQPEDVAHALVRGATAGRFTITPGWRIAALHRLAGPLGPLLARYFDYLARRDR